MVKKEKIKQLLTISEPELEVLKYFCMGEPYKKMSKELFMAAGTVRSHMRNIYIKLSLFGYSTAKRRFIVIKEYCHLLCNPEYLKALEEGVKDIDQEGKALILIEPDEERDQDVDDMIEEDSKYWPMIIPINEVEELPPVDLIRGEYRSKPKPNPFQIGLFVFALIGFAAVAIIGYEFLSGRFSIVPANQAAVNLENPQEPVTVQSTQASAIVQPEPTQAIIQPTNTEMQPTEPPTPAPTSPPKPAILFEDDFESGLSDAWEIVSGNPIIVNGMLSADQDTWLIVGDPSWQNYSIEFLSTEKGYSSFYDGFNAIGVHASDIDNMYAYKWVEHESICSIVRNGEWSEVPQSGFPPGYGPHDFRITVKNDRISVFLNGELEASFFNNEYINGRITLRIFDVTSIDNFIIREILE